MRASLILSILSFASIVACIPVDSKDLEAPLLENDHVIDVLPKETQELDIKEDEDEEEESIEKFEEAIEEAKELLQSVDKADIEAAVCEVFKTCGLCEKEMTEKEILPRLFQCQHVNFHKACLKAKMELCDKNGLFRACPNCDAVAESDVKLSRKVGIKTRRAINFEAVIFALALIVAGESFVFGLLHLACGFPETDTCGPVYVPPY